MTQSTSDQQFTEEHRKQIFFALVDTQDHGLDVHSSRNLMVQRFGVSESQVREIEREGLRNQWPPLGAGSEAVSEQRSPPAAVSEQQLPPQQPPSPLRIFKA